MKYLYNLIVVICILSCSNQSIDNAIQLKNSLDLVFRDEFDQKHLDSLKWNSFSSSPAPFDRILPRGNCDFTNAAILRDENIKFENGYLNLITKREALSYKGIVGANPGENNGCDFIGGEDFTFNQKFSSASIFSKKGYDHGYFECRAKIPCAYGLYPVFWLWHHDEIVVFEFFGNSKNHFVSSHNKEKYVTKKFSKLDYCENFHNYAVHWTNKNITWYFDEIPIWRICRNETVTQKFNSLTTEADSDIYNIGESFPDSINRWLSPNVSLRVYEWATKIDLANIPDTLIIDYVRVYQNKK